MRSRSPRQDLSPRLRNRACENNNFSPFITAGFQLSNLGRRWTSLTVARPMNDVHVAKEALDESWLQYSLVIKPCASMLIFCKTFFKVFRSEVRERLAKMGKGGHSDDESTPYDQRLEEVEFMRSACSAAQRGKVAELERMLQRNPFLVNCDGVNNTSGYTPLHYACREGHIDVVRFEQYSNFSVSSREQLLGSLQVISR
eukprot:1194534-Prorocentrum_minimum.AAC.6